MVAVIQEKKWIARSLYNEVNFQKQNFWLKQRAYINCENNNNGQNMINKYQNASLVY